MIPGLFEPWADTGTSTGRLMIAVLGALADVERDLIPLPRLVESGEPASTCRLSKKNWFTMPL